MTTALVSAACLADSVTNSVVTVRQGALELESAVGQPVLNVGDTTSLVFTLRNIGVQRLDLVFNSGCQVVPFIETAADAYFYPPNGVLFCTAAITYLSLDPGAEHVTTLFIKGGNGGQSQELPLPVGDYRAFARVVSTTHSLESPPLTIQVR